VSSVTFQALIYLQSQKQTSSNKRKDVQRKDFHALSLTNTDFYFTNKDHTTDKEKPIKYLPNGGFNLFNLKYHEFLQLNEESTVIIFVLITFELVVCANSFSVLMLTA
jgi:hypothetical protein